MSAESPESATSTTNLPDTIAAIQSCRLDLETEHQLLRKAINASARLAHLPMMRVSKLTDLVAEAGMQPYDYLAPAVVVAGAGGTITDWSGAPLTLDSPGSVLAAGDQRVHAAALELLSA